MKYKDKEFLIEEYIVKNKSATQIAIELNIHSSSIYRFLKKFGIEKDKTIIQTDRCLKQQQSLLDKYGINNPILIPGATEKAKATNIEKYGVSTYLNSKDGKERSRVTSLVKYGTEHPFSSKEIQDKQKDTMLFRYNVEKPLQKEEFKDAFKETMKEKYGYDSVLGNPEMMETHNAVMLKRYGVHSIAQTSEGISKILNTKVEKGQIKLVNGQLKTTFAKDNDIPYSTLTHLMRSTNITAEEILKQEFDNQTSLEHFSSKVFKLDKYNKYFDLEKYQELRYKPDFKLSEKAAFNVDGLYWHSEINKDKNYHFDMRRMYEQLGLRVFQFREDEVMEKHEIIQSILNNFLGHSHKIGARKTKILKLSISESKNFYEKNHIKGWRRASKHYGLKFQDEIVFAASVIKTGNILKIERLCSKIGYTIIGGWSKILKQILKEYSSVDRVEYWVDLRYGTGNFLDKFGFKIERDILGWEWTDKKKTYNRLQCKANMDQRKLSQQEYAAELGWIKIYDAGQRLWSLNLKDKSYA